jgi:hypothetical protein
VTARQLVPAALIAVVIMVVLLCGTIAVLVTGEPTVFVLVALPGTIAAVLLRLRVRRVAR